MSIIANVGVLAIFKYYNFFAGNINQLFHINNLKANIPLLNIILPIGLSFHTFQAMSYTIEVYRGNQKSERHLGIYALYVMFYPQLVAGPIERPQNVIHQFYEKHTFDFDNCKEGLKLMLWGLFKKIVIADRLSMVVNNIYNHPKGHNGVALTVASIFFAFQIYCDFSGYTDIAIGAAKVMGFKLMKNFDRPYSSKTISEFWSRWHISLSTWFRDYLYIPLGGNRVSRSRWFFNLFIVFLVSGFWHGASWRFIIWGALHGVYLIFAIITLKYRHNVVSKLGITKYPALNNTLNQVTVFFLVTFAWIFFRANSIQDSIYIISHAATGWHNLLSVSGIKSVISELGANDILMGSFNVCIGILLILFMEFIQNKGKENSNAFAFLSGKKESFKWSFYYLIIIAIIAVGVYDNQEFIYFQF